MSRTLAERFGPAPAAAAPSKAERLERLAAQARRLADACRAESAVPRAVAERAAALAGDLDGLARR
jgi:hypothetical protein